MRYKTFIILAKAIQLASILIVASFILPTNPYSVLAKNSQLASPNDHQRDDHENHKDHAGHRDHEDRNDHKRHQDERVIHISKKEMEEFDIRIATAGPGKLKRRVKLPGEIIVAPERLAHMVPRFPGVVKEIRKQIGDKVAQGEVLAIIENNESLVPYEVKSLINGVVMDVHLTRGEVTSGASGNEGVIVGAKQGFIIADLSTVWVNLSIYQKDLQYINVGNEVVISAGAAIPETTGKISYITPFLYEKTRTATARIVLPNTEGYWKPGLFVTGKVTTGEIEASLLIPKSAIETIEGKSVVFIETDDGFKPQPVITGHTNETDVEIAAGLKQGERYVAKNGFTLKAELMKGEFDDGHAH